jgi:glutamyl-tRNA reductase
LPWRMPATRITIINRTVERAEELLADVLATLDFDPIMTYASPRCRRSG